MQFSVFSHTTSRNSDQYRTIMQIFMDAKARFVLHLRSDTILQGLNQHLDQALDRNALEILLKQLCEWGNLRAYQDTTEVATVKEFMRKRLLYQITAEGEAAESALSVFREQLETPGQLQGNALEDIRDILERLVDLVATTDHQQRTPALLNNLIHRFKELTDQAQRFMSALRRHIDLYDEETRVFIAYKQLLIEYLQRFIQKLAIATTPIAKALETLTPHIDAMLEKVVAWQLQDAFETSENQRQTLLSQWHVRWRGLGSWFIAGPDGPAQAQELRQRALQAIPELLNVVRTFNERNSHRGDRIADLRTLARWFMECDDHAQANRLWRAAFGLHSARHLRVSHESLQQFEDAEIGPQTSWLDAPPLEVAPRLRKYGTTRKRGRAPALPDYGNQKATLAAHAKRQAMQIAAARRQLANADACMLSELQYLNPVEFDLFFELLGNALAHKVLPQQETRAQSADGSLEIQLKPATDDAFVPIYTTQGTLYVPQHQITIKDLMPSEEVIGE